jgi:hypothetical protein
VIQTWTTNPENPRRVEIIVYAGAAAEGGRALAQQRADSLRTYLLENFSKIESQHLTALGMAAEGGAPDQARVEIRATPR